MRQGFALGALAMIAFVFVLGLACDETGITVPVRVDSPRSYAEFDHDGAVVFEIGYQDTVIYAVPVSKPFGCCEAGFIRRYWFAEGAWMPE